MKKLFLSFLFISVCFISPGQTANDYVLVPGASFLLPVEENMKLDIQWLDVKGNPHEGLSDFTKLPAPEWTINGHSINNQNKADGNLNVDLTFENATYTAPAFVPHQNPVTIAVRFHSNDSSKELVTLLCNVKIVDPGNKWYISYNYSETNLSSNFTE
jgi:hypothetical protein